MYPPTVRLWAASAYLVLVSGCLQVDQESPFQLADDGGATVTIGANGGSVSVPPTFSIAFPAGSYAGSVSVLPRLDDPFPDDVGAPVPRTAFDVGPAGTLLPIPARVQVSVPIDQLAEGDEVRLGVALIRDDQTLTAFTGEYDVTNGLVSAEIDELGPVAVVLIADAIPVGLGTPPALTGGSITPPPPPVPAPGPSLSSHGGVEFASSCSPDARRCFSSGILRVWADEVVQSRLGTSMFLVNPTVDASLDFLDFAPGDGVPQTVVGQIRVGGELRARIKSTVTDDIVDEVESTGPGQLPTETSVTFSGATMIFAQTSGVPNAAFEYAVTDIGTSQLLIVRIEAEVEFDNGDRIGRVMVDVRMRR